MNHSGYIVSLFAVKPGQWLKVHSLPQGLLRAQFIRLGIAEGTRIQCAERLPGGTVIIQRNRQQVSIGHLLAKQIFVLVVQIDESEP